MLHVGGLVLVAAFSWPYTPYVQLSHSGERMESLFVLETLRHQYVGPNRNLPTRLRACTSSASLLDRLSIHHFRGNSLQPCMLIHLPLAC
jgi:hypothetical protein